MLYIFDMGNVLLTNIDVIDKMAVWFDDKEEFLEDFKHYDFPIMDGAIECEQYYRHVEDMFGVKIEGDPFYDFFHPDLNQDVVKAISDLKAMGHRVVAGTNNCVPHWKYITGKGWDKLFDKCYASHIEHCSKPFSPYYNRILNGEGYKAEEAMMIDDVQRNLDGAAKLGMKTFLYKYKTFEGDLTQAILKASF